MRLCMFHPHDRPMERGWVGRIDGDRVLHLATQTLQSFFLGGSGAREHAEYPLNDVTLLVPVEVPPTVRLFDSGDAFRFANASAVVGPGVAVAGRRLSACGRVAVVIGADGAIGGTTALLEWQDPAEEPDVKRSDFGIVIGPTVVTADEVDPASIGCRLSAGAEEVTGGGSGFDWALALALAARRTRLRAGDIVAGPPAAVVTGLDGGVRFELDGIGLLDCPVS
jgi:hypothetical protein